VGGGGDRDTRPPTSSPMPVSRSSTWRSQKPTRATIGQRSRRRLHHAQQRERANRPPTFCRTPGRRSTASIPTVTARALGCRPGARCRNAGAAPPDPPKRARAPRINRRPTYVKSRGTAVFLVWSRNGPRRHTVADNPLGTNEFRPRGAGGPTRRRAADRGRPRPTGARVRAIRQRRRHAGAVGTDTTARHQRLSPENGEVGVS
jgi:hypothetical protein